MAQTETELELQKARVEIKELRAKFHEQQVKAHEQQAILNQLTQLQEVGISSPHSIPTLLTSI